MKDCIFCKIIRNELNCYCVYENDITKAFLDINPWTKGHTLVIPKTHYKDIFDIPEKELKEIIKVVKNIALIYKKVWGCDINIIQSSGKNAQQDVFHFHVHIIPRYEYDGQKIQLNVNKELKENLSVILKEIKSKTSKFRITF